MSNELIAAGEAVQNLAKQYASVIRLGAELTRIGSLETREDEINKRVNLVMQREAAALINANEAEAALAALHEQHKAACEAHQNQLDDLLAEANTRASLVTADTDAQARRVKTEAEEYAARVDKQTQAALDELSTVQVAIVERKAELEELNASVAALKAKFT